MTIVQVYFAPSLRIEGLRNKTWMLNHGVADDNVHYQHTMLLTKVMVIITTMVMVMMVMTNVHYVYTMLLTKVVK